MLLIRLVFILFFTLATGSIALAESQDKYPFADPAQQQRFMDLGQELRCLVCQNQTLTDSDAPLAHDLRREVYQQMLDGKSDEEIKAYLTERYGDFVLFSPPVRSSTLVLWFLPLVLVVIGGGIIFKLVRKT